MVPRINNIVMVRLPMPKKTLTEFSRRKNRSSSKSNNKENV